MANVQNNAILKDPAVITLLNAAQRLMNAGRPMDDVANSMVTIGINLLVNEWGFRDTSYILHGLADKCVEFAELEEGDDCES